MLSEETVQILRAIGTARPAPAPFSIDIGALSHAALSYALAGEDMALRKIFKRQILAGQPGLYVDIGCSAPISLSNTYLFYCLGWRGLCVDANAQAAPFWRDSRPGDRFIWSAVAQQPGELFYFRHRTNEGMHRVSHSSEMLDDGFIDQPEKVPARRLDDLFREHIGDRPIDFLSMDIEGAELDALMSNDWRRWRPKVIIVECLDFDLAAPKKSQAVEFLLNQGYRLDSKIAANAIVIDAA